MAKKEFEVQKEREEYKRCMFDHVFIDVDSCLVAVEGIDELARIHNCVDKVEKLTNGAMNGEISFDDVFAKRLAIIKPSFDDLLRVGEIYLENITPDAGDVLRRLKEGGTTVWLLSGGYDEAIYPLADALGVQRDHVVANHLFFTPTGEYEGFDGTNMLCRQGGKREYIKRLKSEGILYGKVAIIGDGMVEIEARDVVDLCIGFGGHIIREKVKSMADVFIAAQTFTALVPILFK